MMFFRAQNRTLIKSELEIHPLLIARLLSAWRLLRVNQCSVLTEDLMDGSGARTAWTVCHLLQQHVAVLGRNAVE